MGNKICSLSLRLLSSALLLLYSGCADETNPAVAHVGERTITEQDLRGFIESLPDHARGNAESPGQERDHLQTMIDMELMLLEAANEGIDRSSAFVSRMERTRKAKLISVFENRAIEITTDESEIADYITAEGLNRALRIADLRVPDLAAANAALSEIAAGASFADVARKRSTNKETAARGGDVGRYVMPDQLVAPLAEPIFSLAAGAVSDSIQIGGGYSIFKVLDETTVELNTEQKRKAIRELEMAKFAAARDSLVADLRQKYQLELAEDGVERFVQALQQGTPGANSDPFEWVLYRHEGGEITAADFLDVARRQSDVLATLTQSEAVVAFAEQNVLPEALIVEAAVREGIDSEEEIVAWLDERAKQLMTLGLRAKVLRARVAITEADVRQYYDANPNKFLHPEQIEVQEILVKTEEEAGRLKRLLEEGAALGELAAKHSLRSPEVRDAEGRFHVHRHEAAQFGGLVEVVAEAETGVLTGPVQVHEGYSVFKVLSRRRKPETFEEAGFRARSQLRRHTHRDAFNDYMNELRTKYDSQVEVEEDRLKAAFSVG